MSKYRCPFLCLKYEKNLFYHKHVTSISLFLSSVSAGFFCQLVMLSFTCPGLSNCRKNTSSFNQSAYLESKLHKPQQQCFLAPFLHVIFPVMLSLLAILLVAVSLKLVCCDFTQMFVPTSIPSCIFCIISGIRNGLFLDQKRSAIQTIQHNAEKQTLENKNW